MLMMLVSWVIDNFRGWGHMRRVMLHWWWPSDFARGQRCSTPLGRTMPECDAASSSLVLSVQSVPGADYVSCIDALRVGWEYEHLVANVRGNRRTRSTPIAWATGFVEVSNQESCDVGDAVRVESRPDVEPLEGCRCHDGTSMSSSCQKGPTEETSRRAVQVAIALNDTEIKGRTIAVTPSDRGCDHR